MADTDLSMLELFRAEVETHAPAISEGLLALEKDPAQTKRIEPMMRAAHSIKGAARIVGVEPAVRLAHVMEDYFVTAQAGTVRLDSNVTDVLLRAVDMLAHVALDPNYQATHADEYQGMLDAVVLLKEGKSPAKVQPAGDPSLVTLDGDLDDARAEAIRPLVMKLLDANVEQVQFEFSKVEDIHPRGLALLSLIASTARLRGLETKLRVRGARPEVRNVLHMTRLDRDYQIA